MTDRELLELAAKAAGFTWWQSKHGYWNVTTPSGKTESCCVGWDISTIDDALTEIGWNPLTDDGDALRLAVKLNVDVFGSSDCRMCEWDDGVATEQSNNDPYAATRRAIVRAAAEIGRAMP